MIAGVKPINRERQPSAVKSSWRKGDWSTIIPTLATALCIYTTLTYLWDTADGGRLALLILFSATFGLGLGQLPPVRFLLGRKDRDDAHPASETRPRT